MRRQPTAGAGRPPEHLIVEDDAAPEPGQMGRSAFLEELLAAAAQTASSALEGTLWALAVESGVRERLAPYRGAGDADGPKDEAVPTSAVLAQLPGARMAADVAQILFKRRPDAPSTSADPRAILRRLGPGRPLDAGVRARIEPALGGGLGEVHVHADSRAADVSAELGASAFTTGRHIAFAAGEYAPGTPVGDALLAHELAHVSQQGTGGALSRGDEPALEADADASAETAVAALYGGELRVARRPRLRDGLALRRCTPEKKKEKPPPAPEAAPIPKAADEPMPANPKAVYDAKLPEAVAKLKVAFGRAEGTGMFDKRSRLPALEMCTRTLTRFPAAARNLALPRTARTRRVFRTSVTLPRQFPSVRTQASLRFTSSAAFSRTVLGRSLAPGKLAAPTNTPR